MPLDHTLYHARLTPRDLLSGDNRRVKGLLTVIANSKRHSLADYSIAYQGSDETRYDVAEL